jgi:hypothetical protein
VPRRKRLRLAGISRSTVTPALLAIGLGIIAFAVSGSAPRLYDLPFSEAQSGPVRVCVIVGVHGRRRTASCAHGGVPITGLPAGTNWAEVSVAAVGDVTGDRYGDIAVSDAAASFHGRARAGVTWIVGESADQGTIDLANPDGADFEIGGASAHDGASVQIDGPAPETGDVSGGGLDSVLLTSQPSGGDEAHDGATVWVVGGSRSGRTVDLARLGDRGFAIDGPVGTTIGYASILGDVNGNGHAAVGVQDSASLGEDAVVYGSTSRASVQLARLGSRGFLIHGLAPAVGGPIAGAGDQNGDGLADILVGNPWSGGNCGPTSPITTEICPGAAYLIYGSRAGASVNVHRLRARGYTIVSRSGATDGLGSSVAAVGSGPRRDLLIGDNADVMVIFPRALPRADRACGCEGSDHSRALNLDGREHWGFQISFPTAAGIALGPADGPQIAGIGDINGDGRPDILLQPSAPTGNSIDSYVVYGKTSRAPVNVAQLGGDGFRIR